jgi:hypothetical protein
MERAITQFGSIEDMAFPNVPPDATTEQVNELAKSFLEKILQTIKNTPSVTAVHLMGEMTFIVSLTRLLQQANIKVVCSTTERIVLAEIDGKKTMQFQFCQFREYPRV